MNEQFKILDSHGGITVGQELKIVKSGKNVGRFIKMNERIQELALQAGITTNLDTDYFEKDINKWIDYFSKKFAELIIRECADVCESMQLIGPYKEVQDATLKDASVQIKEHFGVE